MKKFKFFALSALVALPCVLSAAEDDTIMTFGTTGIDTYADGTTQVLDNECYALVWVKAGSVFGGIAADGSAVDAANNRIIGIFPVASGGKCPDQTVEFTKAYLDQLGAGSFRLVMLDTRKGDGTVSVKDGKFDSANGRVNGYVEVLETAASFSVRKASEPVSIASVSEIPGYIDQKCRIVDFKVDGEYAYITVAGTTKILDYGVSAGETADAAQAGKADKSVQAGVDGGTVTFKVPKSGVSGFYKVDRAPLK